MQRNSIGCIKSLKSVPDRALRNAKCSRHLGDNLLGHLVGGALLFEIRLIRIDSVRNVAVIDFGSKLPPAVFNSLRLDGSGKVASTFRVGDQRQRNRTSGTSVHTRTGAVTQLHPRQFESEVPNDPVIIRAASIPTHATSMSRPVAATHYQSLIFHNIPCDTRDIETGR